MKRNAQCVPSTLRGGQLGFLGLVLSDDDYNLLPNSRPFVKPRDPGPFIVIPPVAPPTRTTPRSISATEIVEQKAAHDEEAGQQNEYNAVERALRQQIIDAIEPDYLEALRTYGTDMIHDNIPTIFTFLQESYGYLTEQEFAEKEDELKKFVYNPFHPVDTVFNQVNRFNDLCVMTNNTKSDK